MKKLIPFFLLYVFIFSEANAQLTQSNFISVVTPQYICSGTATRLPYVYRASVTGLLPNTKYRYYSQACRYTDFGGNNSGAGNPILINGSDFRYTTSTSLSTPGGYDSLNTDSQGNYTGWFGFVHTGNARFTAGNYVYPSITLDSAGNGSTFRRYALNDSILVLQFADSANAVSGTGLYGISLATAKNIVSIYDNVNNTGRPIVMAIVESDGIDASAMPSLVPYYVDSVDARNGRWGTVIPNILSTGVRRVNVHRLSDASIANFQTDADGIWPSGVSTVNPAGGSANPIRLTQQDVPLSIVNTGHTPDDFRLEQNYPNPFNPSTTIGFEVPSAGFVQVRVFDILGKELSILVSQNLQRGTYEVTFDGSRLNSGVYFYTLDFNGENGIYRKDSKKLILSK
jgi:hypothetical protein